MKVDREICVGCGACVNICPRFAIRFIDDKSYIDQATCVECGTCRVCCGVDAIYCDCRFPDVLIAENEQKEELQRCGDHTT